MKLFSGSSNMPLAENIAALLGIPLSPLELHVFPDGERRIKLNDVVLEEDAVVVQPTATPVDQNYMELFFMIDALKRSGARSVAAVVSYFGYQRQDHIFRDGEAVSLEVVITMLESVGTDRVITFDLHSIKIPEMFHIPIVHLSALPRFAQKIKEENWVNDNTVLVTPDMGGIRRIKILSGLLEDLPFACIVKNRDLVSGTIKAEEVQGHLKDRAIIVDDMISSGQTIVEAAKLLFKKGVKEVYVFATHPVFSEEAPELLDNSGVHKVYVTDTVLIPKEKRFGKLEILTVAPMVSEVLKEKEI